MLVTRKSPLTGKTSTMDLPITEKQLHRWKVGREPIQRVMPHLTAEQREFVMTGYTPEDWAVMFPPEEED